MLLVLSCSYDRRNVKGLPSTCSIGNWETSVDCCAASALQFGLSCCLIACHDSFEVTSTDVYPQ